MRAKARLAQFCAASGLRSSATQSFEGDTLQAIDRLRAAGLEQVIVVELTLPEFPMIDVVKVIVPGLESYKFDFYKPGRRALAFVNGGQP